MKEFNINMEGYNVNGVCVSCLAHGRRMHCLSEAPKYFRLLADIEVPSGVQVQICWECAAELVAVQRFSERVRQVYSILQQYSQQQPFLNTPADLSKHCKSRLRVDTLGNINYIPAACPASPPSDIKQEEEAAVEDDVKFEHVEVSIEAKDCVKVELPPELSFLESGEEPALCAADSCSEDEKLSALSARQGKRERRRERKKRKKKKSDKHKDKQMVRSRDTKERRALQLKHYRKLSNLPADCVQTLALTEKDLQRLRSEDLLNPDMLSAKYTCQDCIVGFNTRKLMEDHINSKHIQLFQHREALALKMEHMGMLDSRINDVNSDPELNCQCDICKMYFLTEENLSVHRALHLVGYRCVLCDLVTSTKYVMTRHVKREHRSDDGEAGVWPCGACEKIFTSKSKLSYHRSAKHQERPQCDCCGKVFANKMTLKYHLKILPYDKTEKAPKEKLYIPCKGCGKVFHSRKSYSAHVVIHEGLEYPCPVCGKLFQWKRNLARHIRNHREKDTGTFYECRQCDKRFSSKDCYNNHMKLSKRHVSEETYGHACEHCGRRFPSRWCLVDHVDWEHLRNYKYQCRHCRKAFKTSKIMVAHINNIHENKKGREPEGEHLCDICGKSYKTEKRLKGHVWAMHTHRSTSKTFKCKLCPATFTWQTSIYKHVKMMHSGAKQRKPAPRALLRPRRAEAPPAMDIQQYEFPAPPQLQLLPHIVS